MPKTATKRNRVRFVSIEAYNKAIEKIAKRNLSVSDTLIAMLEYAVTVRIKATKLNEVRDKEDQMDEKLMEYFGAIANGYTLVDRGMIIDDFKRIYFAGCKAQSEADMRVIKNYTKDHPLSWQYTPSALLNALAAAAIVEKP
jgi:hypothetical protein